MGSEYDFRGVADKQFLTDSHAHTIWQILLMLSPEYS